MSGVKRERICGICGIAFTGRENKCLPCQITARVCISCSASFNGRQNTCPQCQSTAKQCIGCGRPIKSINNYCRPCRSIERICTVCGAVFTDTYTKCYDCRPHGTMTLSQRKAYENKRRAIKRSAEFCGPVSSNYYEYLRTLNCVYCGEIDSKGNDVDHVRPLSRGGIEHESNLVSACDTCNSSKRARLLTEWDISKVIRAASSSYGSLIRAELSRLGALGLWARAG